VSSARQHPLATPTRPLRAHRHPVRLGGTLLLVSALLAAPLLAGCGTGQVSQTAVQQSSVDGAQGTIGPIAVRNAMIVYPEGGQRFYPRGSNAPLSLTVANTGTSEDELAGVASDVAGAVRIEGQQALRGQGTLNAIAPSGATGAGGSLGRGQVRIVLTGLTEDVRPGKTVRVRLLFRQAGELTMDIPVGPPAEAG